MPLLVTQVQYSAKGTDTMTTNDKETSKAEVSIHQVQGSAFDLEVFSSNLGEASEKKRIGAKLMEQAIELPPPRRRFLCQNEANETVDDPNADLDFESDSTSVSIPRACWSYCRDTAGKAVDSNICGNLGVLLVLIDVFLFLSWLILLLGNNYSPILHTVYRALDWVTAVTFLGEAGLRVLSYGIIIYFRSALRACDVLISTTNACAVIAMAFPNSPLWIKATRFLRLLRIVLILEMMRKRTNKWQAQTEVEELEILLEMERSNQNKLTKWKIESDAIAVGDTAGEGGFGTVHLGLFRGTLVAVKQLFETDTRAYSASIADEAVILVNLRHPNVVLFMGFVHEPKRLWIVTEYCSRGSLRDLLDDEHMELSHSRILKFALGAARGLAYLHGQDPHVLHLDLKTSNILISSGWDAKLADFGLARSADKPQKGKFVGTIQYSPPEILESNIFGTEADIYSFGICLWEMAAREIPFNNVPKMDLICGIVQSHMRPDLSRIKRDDNKVELPAQLNIDDIEVREASTLAVLRSIASSQSEAGPVQKHGVKFSGMPGKVATSPVTPKIAADDAWGDEESGSRSQSASQLSPSSGSASTSISAWHGRIRRKSAPLITNRPALTTRPALAASATQVVTMDQSGNSYSAGEVAEATELVHEQAGLNDEDSFALLIDSGGGEIGPKITKFASEPQASALAQAIGTATPDERYMYYKARRQLEKETKRKEEAERPNVEPENSSGRYCGWERYGAVTMCKEYCELIELCWAHDPKARPSADEVVWRLVGMIDNELRSD